MFANPNRITVMERGAFHAQIVHKGPVKAVEILNDEPVPFEIHARVIIRNCQVVHGQIVVRRPPNADRPAAYGDLLHDFFVKHEAELRHLRVLLRNRSRPLFSAPRGAATKTNLWNPLPRER